MEVSRLSYRGLLHARYWVYEDGTLKLRFKDYSRAVNIRTRPDGYRYWRVKHPLRGRFYNVMAHVAVLESFTGIDPARPYACHKPGTTRSDVYLGCCAWGTQQENRSHRRETNTHSTGRNTKPGKFTLFVDDLLRDYDNGYSAEDLRDRYDWVTWKTIRNHLIRNGRISVGERV